MFRLEVIDLLINQVALLWLEFHPVAPQRFKWVLN